MVPNIYQYLIKWSRKNEKNFRSIPHIQNISIVIICNFAIDFVINYQEQSFALFDMPVPKSNHLITSDKTKIATHLYGTVH